MEAFRQIMAGLEAGVAIPQGLLWVTTKRVHRSSTHLLKYLI